MIDYSIPAPTWTQILTITTTSSLSDALSGEDGVLARPAGRALGVQAKPGITTAELAAVTSAAVVAFCKAGEGGSRLSGRSVAVSAPALAAPFSTTVSKAAGRAEGQAGLIGHGVARGGGAGQSAECTIGGPAFLGSAADVPPAVGSLVSVREAARSAGGGGASGSNGNRGGCGGDHSDGG